MIASGKTLIAVSDSKLTAAGSNVIIAAGKTFKANTIAATFASTINFLDNVTLTATKSLADVITGLSAASSMVSDVISSYTANRTITSNSNLAVIR